MTMLVGLVVVIALALLDHPVAACKALASGLLLLAVYRAIDRSPKSWLAVRSYAFDIAVLLGLSVLILLFSPFAGVLMPQILR